ncbi:MAG: hypothetical protein JWQ74_3585 [Marmoricola sp.]|nr:hypothetical protein [Marmoricola sp.]
MVLSVSSNTYFALQNARKTGIVPRDFVWIRALNTSTDAIETIGLWNGEVPVSVAVIKPSDGTTVTRTYQPMAGLMAVPAIPATMKLEVRSARLTFSSLSPAVINAVLVYNPKNQPIEIHRGLFDPATMNLVDPAWCRFDGLVNRAPVKRAKIGNDGQVQIECQSHSRNLTFGNPAKLSDEFFKRRGGDGSGRYLDIVPKIVWGQEVIVHENDKKPKERFHRP